MTAKNDLKSMLLQFRIAELQDFLETFGARNVKLRKKELQKKALKIMNTKRASSVANKIISLYRKMNSSRRRDNSSYDVPYDSAFTKRRKLCREKLQYDDSFYPTVTFSDSHYSDYKPTNPLDLSQNSSFLSSFENLDVERIKAIKFPNLPFFEHISDIMLVTPLIPRSECEALFEFKSTFSLSAEAFQYLFCCDDKNSKYEAMLRLCLFNDKLEIEDSLPTKLYVSINDSFCSCASDVSSSRYELSGKRPGAPINITSYIGKQCLTHKLILHWTAMHHMTYAVTIQLVKKRAADELIKQLIDKGEQNPAVSKKLIYNNLSDEDNEVAATSLKMSLICPLGKMLMTLPTRSTTCNHLQCFDGSLFIKMNEIKSTWQCPVCSKSCSYENLFIDGYFMNIIRSENFSLDIRDVQLNADGSWESATVETKKRPRLSPIKLPEKKAKTVSEDCQEVLPESDHSLQGSFVDDLREIFNSIIDFPSHQYPTFSSSNILDNSKDMPDSVSSNSHPEPSDQFVDQDSMQKNVLLVDLTLSDSESDDVKSTSSFSSENPSVFSPDRLPNDLLCSNPSPPIYDILDSD